MLAALLSPGCLIRAFRAKSFELEHSVQHRGTEHGGGEEGDLYQAHYHYRAKP
jgi:hypothetical protein